MVCYVNFNVSSQDPHFLLYIKLLSDLILIDIIYDKAYDSSFHQKIESAQYSTCLAIACTIRSTSKGKLCDELGLESLQLRRWFRKLCYFYKFYKHECPQQLFELVSLRQSLYGGAIVTITFEMSEALVLLKTIS